MYELDLQKYPTSKAIIAFRNEALYKKTNISS